ncbi:MAG: hypothetical protein GEV06_07725 [Luteitalea sp.]|nr:hypothetical protein [Luteitalea sp.]
MKDKLPLTVELEQSKIDFLEEMAQTYNLPDTGKAIRCLIDYARENADLRQTIFDEIRCVDCDA